MPFDHRSATEAFKLPFSPAYDYKALKAFNFNGRKYLPGQPFPKTADGERDDRINHKIEDRLLLKFWRTRHIYPIVPGVNDGVEATVANELAADRLPPAAKAAPTPSTAKILAVGGEVEGGEGTEAPDTETGSSAPESTPAPGAWTAVHFNFGKHNVLDSEGTVIATGLTKEQADSAVASKTLPPPADRKPARKPAKE